MDADVSYHFPPDLLELLVKTIPILYKGKEALLVFFQGVRVPQELYQDLAARVQRDRSTINKYEIVRTILVRLSEKGNKPEAIRLRREIVRRVEEWEDFSSCYEDKVLEAKGLVAEVRRVRYVVDSFRRMEQEKDAERKRHRDKVEAERLAIAKQNAEFQRIKDEFSALFSEADVNKRGKALEPILNRMFAHYGILVREAFARQGSDGEGTLEQIDGVVEVDGTLYLIEMKWRSEPIGVPHMAHHVNRLLLRGNQVRGLFISASGFAKTAVTNCKALRSAGVVMGLCELRELFELVERRDDLRTFLKSKFQGVLLD